MKIVCSNCSYIEFCKKADNYENNNYESYDTIYDEYYLYNENDYEENNNLEYGYQNDYDGNERNETMEVYEDKNENNLGEVYYVNTCPKCIDPCEITEKDLKEIEENYTKIKSGFYDVKTDHKEESLIRNFKSFKIKEESFIDDFNML